MARWFEEVRSWEEPGGFDELLAGAADRLAGCVGAPDPGAQPVVALAGWSRASREVLLGSGDGFKPVEVTSYAFNPWPDTDAADYPDLERLLSVEPARMTQPAQAHLALAANQARGYRRGAYGPGMAGGRLRCARVTEAGVEVEVLADLDAEA